LAYGSHRTASDRRRVSRVISLPYITCFPDLWIYGWFGRVPGSVTRRLTGSPGAIVDQLAAGSLGLVPTPIHQANHNPTLVLKPKRRYSHHSTAAETIIAWWQRPELAGGQAPV
jgi:hypothetical protein